MRRPSEARPRLTRLLALIGAALVVVGVVALMTWDIPPPTSRVEIVIPDDRFPK